MPATLTASPRVLREIPPGNSLTLAVTRNDQAALREWRDLELRLGNDFLFCSWEWVRTWIEVFGDQLPHEYLLARHDDETVGIALLVAGSHREGPFRVRTLHFGTAGEPACDSVFVEDNRPLVSPRWQPQYLDLLGQYADADHSWDALHFDGLAGEAAAPFLAIRHGASIRRVPSHYFDLQDARTLGTNVLSRLGSSTRRNIKQSLKYFGDVTVDWAETPQQADDIFNDLIRLHQARWAADGEPGCYSSTPFTEFHRRLIHRLLPQKKVVLTRARRGDDVLGCVQLFVERNRLLYYQCGSARLDPKISPGLITDYLSMEAGLERGYDAYDFLAGDTVHKRKLSTHAREMIWVSWRRPRWKFRAIDALRGLKRRLSGRTRREAPQPPAK